MYKKNIDISLNTYLPDLLQGLKKDGVDISRFLKQPHLRKFDLFNSDIYVPNILLNNLMESIHNYTGVESIVATLPQHFKATKMGRFSNRIFQSPNLLSFLESVVLYQNTVRTNNKGKLEIFGSIAKFSVFINEASSKGKLIAEEVGLARILDGFRLIGGPDFIPIELGMTAKSTFALEPILPKGDYRIHVDQPDNWILFETSMLCLKVPNVVPKMELSESVPTELTTFKIEKLLESYLPDKSPGLESISEMLNVSSRSIQRRLKDEGTSFLNIIEKKTQLKALELVSNSNLSIKEISELLNFGYSQNFIRTFKKWIGVSPMNYRDKL